MKNNYYLKQKKVVKEFENSLARGIRKSTFVGRQKDYVADQQICLTSVVFVTDHIYKEIVNKIINPLKKIENFHYYYPASSMHLTVKNIKTISKPPSFTQSDIKKVNKLFKTTIPKYPVFYFFIEDILLFPTSLSIMAYSSDDTLRRLFLALDKELKKARVPDNKKYFSKSIFWSNISLCRFSKKPGQKFINKVKTMRNLKIGRQKVNKINLITCNAVCHPDSKKIIAQYKLKK